MFYLNNKNDKAKKIQVLIVKILGSYILCVLSRKNQATRDLVIIYALLHCQYFLFIYSASELIIYYLNTNSLFKQ